MSLAALALLGALKWVHLFRLPFQEFKYMVSCVVAIRSAGDTTEVRLMNVEFNCA